MPVLMKASASAASQPAPWFITGLGTIAGLIAATAHTTPDVTAALASAAAAIGVIWTASHQKPVAVTVILGAASTVVTDLVVLNAHLSPAAEGAVIAAVASALGGILHLAKA